MSSNESRPSLREDFFDRCSEILCIVGAGGAIQDANRAFFRTLGFDRQELGSLRFLDLVHENDREESARALEASAAGGERVPMRNRFRAKDGSYLPVEWLCSGDPEAGTSYLLGKDATVQRQMESALVESRETALALFENAAQGILTVDHAGNIRGFNAMAERLFGYSREEVVGGKLEKLMPESFSDAHARHRQDYFASPRTRPMGLGMDLVARRKDGSEFPVEISLSHIRSGEETLAVAFVNDVSERKRSELEKNRLERQLEHATKMEAVGRLAGGIAHDFNNLLTALSGFAEIVLDELPESHPLYQGAQETLKLCQRSTALVRRLLVVSRRQVLKPEPMELNAKIAEIEKMLRSLLGEDIDLVVKLHPERGLIRADESQIEQVVLNLVVNARDAMPQGGRLVIQTSVAEVSESKEDQYLGVKPGSYLVLTVSDTGVGMDRETLKHIFEPFFTTKERGKGTGLGLATVYGIVTQSGGHVFVYSELAKGTTFKVYLPRIAQAEPDATGTAGPRTSPQGYETILVVEDENTVRLVAVANLRKAGYHVLEARNAEEALHVLTAHGRPIDLVLTDVLMPGIHGPELVKRIKERQPEIKTLYMSGHADDALLHHGVLEGGLAFLEKPFTRDELTSRVREVLDGS